MVETACLTRPAVSATVVSLVLIAALAFVADLLTGWSAAGPHVSEPSKARASAVAAPMDTAPRGPTGTVTLAFAGDVHFEWQLTALLGHPHGALGPITGRLREADLAMVNLESSISHRGEPEAKELEEPENRYHFRTSPAALEVLASAGIDVATVANNHGADYGLAGLQDTLRAIRHGPVHVVGIGADRNAAFTPYRVSVRGTSFAFFGADASFREGSSSVWAAGPHNPGLAAAHAEQPQVLLAAVRAASQRDDVVVVYLHWGEELQGCPTTQQRITAQALAHAGADVVVGSHAHVLLGSGWIDDTYVDYGLGNFVWYNDRQPETGVLQLTVRDGHVVDDGLAPARIGPDGRPVPLAGSGRRAATRDWRRLRDCAGLAARPKTSLPAYAASVHPIDARLRHRMRFSHHPGCPVPLTDLRYLQLTYLGFDAAAHTGELVVHEEYAASVVEAFHRLYAARWPIARMRLVDDYRGDDERSMAANNTSGYNCRRIQGRETWSAHAYGAAIDINPLQNPYLTGSTVHPPAAARFTTIDRSDHARVPVGAIRDGDVVVRAFARIGWDWGGRWTQKDYQHFTVFPR